MNFRRIILPEALKTIQCEEESVMSTLLQLTHIADSAGQSLDVILQKLELQLRNIIMGMQVQYY